MNVLLLIHMLTWTGTATSALEGPLLFLSVMNMMTLEWRYGCSEKQEAGRRAGGPYSLYGRGYQPGRLTPTLFYSGSGSETRC